MTNASRGVPTGRSLIFTINSFIPNRERTMNEITWGFTVLPVNLLWKCCVSSFFLLKSANNCTQELPSKEQLYLVLKFLSSAQINNDQEFLQLDKWVAWVKWPGSLDSRLVIQLIIWEGERKKWRWDEKFCFCYILEDSSSWVWGCWLLRTYGPLRLGWWHVTRTLEEPTCWQFLLSLCAGCSCQSGSICKC